MRLQVRGDPNYDQKSPFIQKHLVCPLLINLVYTHRALLAFRLCDSKDKNSVDLKGLLKKMHHIGLNRSSEELSAEFAIVDSDSSGRLHFSEFYPWFVELNIEHGSFERYRGEDVVPFKRFVLRQEKNEGFELSKFLDAQEIAWKQCEVDPSKMTKEWNRLDQNGNGLVSGAEVDTWVQLYHKPLRLRAVIKQAVIQTLKLENGSVADYIKRDTFPALLVNFVSCMRAWIMFDEMNQTEEKVGLKDKRIEYEEFKNGLMKLSHTITEDIVKAEWQVVDGDGQGMVLFNEFSTWYHLKQVGGWFEQRRQERVFQEAEKTNAALLAAQASKASRLLKEQEEAVTSKNSVLISPFDWGQGASRAQAKLNMSLEAHFLEVFQSSKDCVPNVGLNKLWLALDNNGNGLVSKQELTGWTEKKYPMLSIGAVNEAYSLTLSLDGFGAQYVKRSMFKVAAFFCTYHLILFHDFNAEPIFALDSSIFTATKTHGCYRLEFWGSAFSRAAAANVAEVEPRII
jgi:Ca2+-binding EF-hand superfamily protein